MLHCKRNSKKLNVAALAVASILGIQLVGCSKETELVSQPEKEVVQAEQTKEDVAVFSFTFSHFISDWNKVVASKNLPYKLDENIEEITVGDISYERVTFPADGVGYLQIQLDSKTKNAVSLTIDTPNSTYTNKDMTAITETLIEVLQPDIEDEEKREMLSHLGVMSEGFLVSAASVENYQMKYSRFGGDDSILTIEARPKNH